MDDSVQSNSACCLFIFVIVYPEVFNPLTAYCFLLFWYFCVPCAFVMWLIKSTYLLT